MLTETGWVGVEEADEDFGDDQAADWAKTMAAGPDVGFAKDVVPQRFFSARRALKHCEGCLQRRRSRQQSVVRRRCDGLRKPRRSGKSATGSHCEFKR